MSVLFTGGTNGATADVTAYNANWNLLEASLFDLGPSIISGLVVTIGSGLAVNVASGTASIGGQVVEAAGWTIGGLTPSTTNHLYLLQNGTGAANTTGTAPANAVKLGTCITGASTVTSVAANWASGRQQKARTETLVMGSGAGNPRSLNLASWAASGNEGQECVGILPSAGVDMTGNVILVPPLSTRNVIQPSSASAVPLTIKGAASQAADLLDFVNSSGTALLSIGWQGNLTFAEGVNLIAGTTTGTQLGTATTQKLGFFAATPIVQPANSVDLGVVLSNLGLRASGGNPPLNLGTGALTAGATSLGATTIGGDLTLSAHNLVTDTTTGTQIATGATQKLAFWGATPVAKPTLAGVKSGGTALTNLIALLVTLGVLVDTTT